MKKYQEKRAAPVLAHPAAQPSNMPAAQHEPPPFKVSASKASAPTVQKDDKPAAAAQIGWAELEPVLKSVPSGVDALGIKSKHQVSVEFSSLTAVASFLPDTNKCLVNPKLSAKVAASYFIHEMNHAARFHTGQSPKAEDTEQAKFVDTLVQEEIDGTVKQFEAALELSPSADMGLPCETWYRGAYKSTKEKALKESKTEAEAHQLGLANGKRMVKYLIDPPNNEWPRLAPNTYESYRMYYTREWKSKNKSKTAL